jgi:hypothetical protein
VNPKVNKAYQHFLDNPGAKPMSVAKRFKISVPYAYKLRDKARGGKETPIIQAVRETLTTLPKSVPETLESRATAYGTFRDNARLAQALKRAMAEHAEDMGKTFADDQWEALEMIATKVSRIINGNPDDIDQWHDIAGYATLIADRLQGVV